MAEAILTLSQALIAPRRGANRRQLPHAASMGIAANTLARQAAMKAAKRQLQAQGLRHLTSPIASLSSEPRTTSPSTARS